MGGLECGNHIVKSYTINKFRPTIIKSWTSHTTSTVISNAKMVIVQLLRICNSHCSRILSLRAGVSVSRKSVRIMLELKGVIEWEVTIALTTVG